MYKVLLTVSDVRFLRIGRHGRHLGDVKLHQHPRCEVERIVNRFCFNLSTVVLTYEIGFS